MCYLVLNLLNLALRRYMTHSWRIALQIATNIQSLKNLNFSRLNHQSSAMIMERISSALRINRGADDPSGLYMSQSMKSRTSSQRTAIINAQDALGFLQQRESAMAEVGDMLLRLKELGVRACNEATFTDADRQKMSQEAAALISAIDTMNEDTRFNDMRVFNRSFQIVPGGTGALGFYEGGKAYKSIDLASIYAATGAPVTIRAAWYDGFAMFPDINIMSPDGTEAFGWLYGLWSKPPALPQEGYLDQDAPPMTVNRGDGDVFGIGTMDSADSVTYSGYDPGLNPQGYYEEYFVIDNPAAGLWTIIVDNQDSQDRVYDIFINEPSQKPGELRDTAQIGPDNKDDFRLHLNFFEVDSLTLDLSVSFNTAASAQNSLSSIDDALEILNTHRAQDGITQRRLLSIVDETMVEITNAEATRSRIEDADMAAEITQGTVEQILSQTIGAASVLSSEQPQAVLDLIGYSMNTSIRPGPVGQPDTRGA